MKSTILAALIAAALSLQASAQTVSIGHVTGIVPAAQGGSVAGISGYSGTGTLSTGGTVTVSCTPCTTSSIIGIQDTASSITNVGFLTVPTKNNGSFVVTSTLTLDRSTFDWWVIKP